MKKINKKTIIIITSVAALLIVALLVFFLFINKDTSYRLLKIFEVDGTANVNHEGKGDITPYNNMVLESGDRVSLDTGMLTIQADEDKFIHFQEDTEILLEATGNSANSKTTIELVKGAITNDIQNKLSGDSSYEINTPNSTMSVRGTVYYVDTYVEDGVVYTRVCVFNGGVETWLMFPDGTTAENAVAIAQGKETLIYYDGKVTDYVYETKDIDYFTLPDNVLELLAELDEDGRDVVITSDEANRIINGPYVVTFTNNGKVFGTQTVEKGKKATLPALQPEASGSWYLDGEPYDFDTPIDRDVEIEWNN